MNCQTTKQASQRRRSKTTSRGPLRRLLTSETLDELRKASEMVPTSHSEATISFYVASEAPTSAPPSKEPSPLLSFRLNEPAEIEEVTLPAAEWPSLRESLNDGWDFCSEASDDIDQEEVEGSPASNWCFVTDEAETHIAAPAPEAYAVAKEGSVKVLQVPSLAVTSDETQEGSMCLDAPSECRDSREHGWRKQHKASWSMKQQRKVAGAVDDGTRTASEAVDGWMKKSIAEA
eukprot:CAMPEP_0169411624 /NCGR_PEP_ID=MMETSP1017-20121227/60395_1 /TAXON_ID=342587 /ORGANISM="Karlodinium micrum, Strain CCMP2283" /LENGTH=232 /DNA_ID=CAMNT_0009518931 /DNA_START=65 /DNA_END=761 /DNA_ORIENTATION=-